MRVVKHPILESPTGRREVTITLDGRKIRALEGETIASALIAAGVKVFRTTSSVKETRGYFCGIGLCSDCMMIVNGEPNVRACITPVREGMKIETQVGFRSAGNASC